MFIDLSSISLLRNQKIHALVKFVIACFLLKKSSVWEQVRGLPLSNGAVALGFPDCSLDLLSWSLVALWLSQMFVGFPCYLVGGDETRVGKPRVGSDVVLVVLAVVSS